MLKYFIFGLFLINSVIIHAQNIPKDSLNSVEEEDDSYYPYQDWSSSFDWQLLKAFSSSSQNVMISPISLKLVLALLYEGSSGFTEREFQSVLHFPIEKQYLRDNITKIIESLQPSERKQYVLNLGTRVFLNSDLTPQQNFASKALHSYRTDIEPTNFSHPLDASRTINSWIEKLTNGKVAEMINPRDIKETVMIVGNAIYFKGTWRHQFPKNRTKIGGFYLTPKYVLNVPYMRTVDKFYFFESNDLDAKILRLPYKGKRYALFIILPNSKAGLGDLINKINLDDLRRQLYFMDQVLVDVSIPKFKFNFQAKCTQLLKEMGLNQMFQETASFPGIVRGQNTKLIVSDILQKTGIEVDEEGSVVYAATDVQFVNKFGEAENSFNATHPFMFFIEEQNSGTVLFVGKVENPLEGNLFSTTTRFGTANSTFPATSVGQPLPDLQPENPERDAIVRRFNYFDLELLKEFSENSSNVFISPASIKITLALILEGAKGKCAEEIGYALRIDDVDNKEVRDILNRLLFDLNDRTESTLLETASSVFVSDRYEILKEYQKKVGHYYNAEVNNINFSNQKYAEKIINTWAMNVTHGIIQEIVDEQSLTADTTLIITNALYFKGKWKTEFEPQNTRIKCFQSPTRACVRMPFMQVTETFNYNLNTDLDAHAIELPYQDDNYAMLILLPATGNNIKVMARDMQHAKLNSILDQLRPAELNFELPKFELDFTADLVQFLKPLKIIEIFGPNANLTGIISKENIRINNIVHRTRIEVNEHGTKAAAVSAAVVIPLMGSTAQKIVVDKPFIFLIYHRATRNLIFEGILVEPEDVISNGQPLSSRRPRPRPTSGSRSNRYFQTL